MHSFALLLELALPGAHGKHDAMPCVSWCHPDGQSRHFVGSIVPSSPPPRYCPKSHSAHVAPNFPEEQIVQAAAPSAPFVVRPIGQRSHASLPVLSENSNDAHKEQLYLSALDWCVPGTQGRHEACAVAF